MRQTQFRRAVILSGEVYGLGELQNEQRTQNLQECLNDLNMDYKRVIGVYKGSVETSFIVLAPDLQHYYTLKDLAFKSFNQESILHQNSQGISCLIYTDNRVEELGQLKQISEEKARSLDSYTMVDNQYYAIA
jgi:hypothetical protein